MVYYLRRDLIKSFIPIIDKIKKNYYQITILYKTQIFSYHGIMFFSCFKNAHTYTNNYIKNIIKLSTYFQVSPKIIKQNYRHR